MKKNTNKNEELIHVKLEYDELVQAKRGFISLQRDLLSLVKFIKRYHTFRTVVLNRKAAMNKKLKELDINMKVLYKVLPKLEVPPILKKSVEEEHEELETPTPRNVPSDRSIEKELEDIQNRLDSF